MTSSLAYWISGGTRSGKSTRLLQQFATFAERFAVNAADAPRPMLVFAATGDNRLDLVEQLTASSQMYPVVSATPLGFFQDEVILFYPLLVEQLSIPARFPLRLRPETEQELATHLWQPELESGDLALEGITDYFLVRRVLDLLQLAASGGVALDDIPTVLRDGFGDSPVWEVMGRGLTRWWDWCLERGLLTYGLVTMLYGRYLLPHPDYQHHLRQRYRAVLADDVDEYPAIAHALFDLLLDADLPACFTYNPEGGSRRGLGADPDALAMVQARCQVECLDIPPDTLGAEWAETLVGWVREPVLMPQMPDAIRSLQTTSRAQLLRQTADIIAAGVQAGWVQPKEVAIIGPGLDAIARS